MSKEQVKERLRSYLCLKFETENQLERLLRLKSEEKFPAMRESSGAKQSGSSEGRMEKAIIRRMEYEASVMPKIEAAQKEMEQIEDAISAVRDPMEREVLRLRYVDGESRRPMLWRDVAVKLFGDDDERHILATYRLHSRALASLSKAQLFAEEVNYESDTV